MARLKTVLLTLAIFIFPGALFVAAEEHRPKLVVTPGNLNFFACAIEGQPIEVPEPKRLQIRGIFNDNPFERVLPEVDSLKWYATPDQGWIKIEPDFGRTPGEAMVEVDPSGLEVGEHRGTIRFDTPGQRKPRMVQIKFRIQPAAAATFTLDPASIGFSAEVFSNVTLIDSVRLGVVGADHLDFTASNSQSWLKVVPSQATAPITVLLLASIDSLPAGSYYDTVVFKAPISDGDSDVHDADDDDEGGENDGGEHCGTGEITAFLPVTLTLSPEGQPPFLVVSPGRLGFAAVFDGPNPQPQNLSVSTSGNIDIPWMATGSQSWLHVEPASGTAGAVPGQTQVTVDITGLNPGLYSDTIIFAWPREGAFRTKIPVFLQVFPPSELSDSVAIGDAVVDLTEPDFNRFSVPIFASNTQAVRAIALPLHFEDGQTTLDSVTFSGGRVEFADLKLFLRLSTPGDFLVLVGFVVAPALPPGEGNIAYLHFTTVGVPPQFADTLIIDSTSVPNATGSQEMPQTLSVSYIVISGGNPLVLNPAFKKGTVVLRNSEIPTSADDGDGNRPLKFGLNQNYPNPFNPQTTIVFSLPKSSQVKLEVFDLLGRSVVTLKEGSMTAGRHTLIWNGRDRTGRTVSSGIYLYRLKAGIFVETKKMLFLK
ncbi:MAG: T9SS type A sorting domain-containing protein [candidate division Zixibacteria bacterium]|nr:T9SS type A sorting domain-containing protein [candidate division Zixibacteria bacterium]